MAGPRAAARVEKSPECTAGKKPGRPRSPDWHRWVSPILDPFKLSGPRGLSHEINIPIITCFRRGGGACRVGAQLHRARRREEGIQHRLDDLRRLDAMALC